MRVLSYDEAAGRAGIVRRSLERLIAIGEGPAVVHVSARRRGVIEADLEHWLLSRRRATPGVSAPYEPAALDKLAPANISKPKRSISDTRPETI
jgi:hypothetical protein